MNREAAQSGLPHFPPYSALPPDSEANHVVLAFALRVAETWEVVHRNSSSCGFGGSRGGVPLLVAVTVKLRLPPRQSRGVSYRTLGSSPRRRTNLALDARSTFPAPFFALRLCAALHEAQGFAFGEVVADKGSGQVISGGGAQVTVSAGGDIFREVGPPPRVACSDD